MIARYTRKHLDVKGKVGRKREKKQPVPKKGERKCLTPITHYVVKQKSPAS